MKHSDLEIGLAAVCALFTVIAGILMVLFGQLTVRRLRKDPATREALGLEFYSGYDIFNVALALTLPRAVMRKFRATKLGGLYADVDLVYEYTSRFDRVLGRIFYSVCVCATGSITIIILLKLTGFFN